MSDEEIHGEHQSMGFDFLSIDSDRGKLNNICWTIISMYNGRKYGRWEDAYIEKNIDAKIAAFRRDFDKGNCIHVGRLCAALSVALTPLVGNVTELRALLLHMASHMIDVAYAREEKESPVGPTLKRD